MPYEPFERVALGRSGPARHPPRPRRRSIGGLYRPVADADAIGLVDHAWEAGIRSFDVAPLYGYGAAERRMGAALAGRPRDAFVLSTKVGRLVVPTADLTGAEDDRPPGVRGSRGRVLRRHRRAGGSCSTTRPTASAGRLRRASSAWGSTGSTSPTSTTPTTTGRRDRRRVPGAPPAARGGRRPGDRRGDEPVGDARPGSSGRPTST